MDLINEPQFESTGTITEKELVDLYGPLLRGELVLKLAEHKNFAAAAAAFQTWKDYEVIQMGNLFSQNYRLPPESYKSRDEYIAHIFLKALISVYDRDRREQIRIRMEDPVQQQKAAELLKVRQSGKLPHIDLAGIDFTVDWRLRQMRDTKEPWKNISFDDFEMDDYGDNYLCFFNTETHELYMPPEDLTELPKNVVVLEIPNELNLDPVAVAREYGSDLAELLRVHPITEHLTAKVIPLSETGLPAAIEINLGLRQQGNADERQRVRR